MGVNSWINAPLTDRPAGPAVISGVAFGGMHATQKVEVSLDGGQTWHQANFVGPDLGRFAWRNFAFATELEPGSYTIVSRATDTEGNVQPEETEPNNSGYSHNGWRAPAINIAVG